MNLPIVVCVVVLWVIVTSSHIVDYRVMKTFSLWRFCLEMFLATLLGALTGFYLEKL
ncbi:hypothetical protein C121_16 [Stenotrophomonas phage C121]|uniref:hypothetical protein n=1 Tax=Stenotrophomonas phage C121 TaxID=2914029 RepID=UPI0023290BF4|nr:hypothetical protein PP752_gp16 [Stenotrophomonas phage C121]UKL14749.1 hypothetical protein C121_16 [Stenotrophomonas phage C121]